MRSATSRERTLLQRVWKARRARAHRARPRAGTPREPEADTPYRAAGTQTAAAHAARGRAQEIAHNAFIHRAVVGHDRDVAARAARGGRTRLRARDRDPLFLC